MIKTFYFEQLHSTNDTARSLIENEDEIIVTAEEQISGRGRRERSWLGEKGKNMYFSYAVNHTKLKTFANNISYLAASSLFTLYNFRKFAADITFKLKYPNDIYCLDNGIYKKVSGILIEHTFAATLPKYTIIGIGANINQSNFPLELQAKASSLSKLGLKISVSDFIDGLGLSFERMYGLNEALLIQDWQKEINIVNKSVLLTSQKKQMKVIKHLDDGRLVVQNESEELIIDDGESIIYELWPINCRYRQ